VQARRVSIIPTCFIGASSSMSSWSMAGC